ncbi:hypothetical protein [Terrisporobacter sp.]
MINIRNRSYSGHKIDVVSKLWQTTNDLGGYYRINVDDIQFAAKFAKSIVGGKINEKRI